MKVIAYHLPQYHEVRENSEWWGEGFTEWKNVISAHPLYKYHDQPRVPLNENYYDLGEIENLKAQFDMANDYGVYGFCFYHYWFEGRKILEKPVEALLNDASIDGKFCFCWANHSWRRTWNKTNELLIEQKYGDIKEWDEHLTYLLPFFNDPRYIKHDGKPVFVVYDMAAIERCKERFEYYNDFLFRNGFKGIYLVQSINDRGQEYQDVANLHLLREPAITHVSTSSFFKRIERRLKRNKNFEWFKKPVHYVFSELMKGSLNYSEKELKKGENIAVGLFREWDSTPRHGKHGYIISRARDDEFIEFIDKTKSLVSNYTNCSEFVFYNAWNEWGESCYLEPDDKYGFSSLEIICERLR
jgi:hypothetical protein